MPRRSYIVLFQTSSLQRFACPTLDEKICYWAMRRDRWRQNRPCENECVNESCRAPGSMFASLPATFRLNSHDTIHVAWTDACKSSMPCELAPRIAAHHLGLNPPPIQLTDAHCETCSSGPLLSFSKSCKHIMEHSTMRTKCNCISSPPKHYLHIKHLNVHFRYCEQYVTRVLVLLSGPAWNLDF